MHCGVAIVFGLLLQYGVGKTKMSVEDRELERLDEGHHRQGRFFPFYTIGRIANAPCTATSGLDGTCLIRGECTDNDGTFSGPCNTLTNQATCCVYTRSCGDVTRFNNTYFVNPDYPGPYNDAGSCAITVIPDGPEICQLLISFRSFNLLQPNGDGVCTDDTMTITGAGVTPPVLCGENTDQHMYLPFSGNSAIRIDIRTNGDISYNRNWNLELTQIACDSPDRAPNGCLQYYTDTSGEISSFNFGLGANSNSNSMGMKGTRQIANTNYGICIRPAADRCSITYSLPSSDNYAFTVTGDADSIDPAMVGMGTVGINGDSCTTDYIIIPNPSNGMEDRFCGLGFDSVTSASSTPYVVYVVTDGDDSPDVANRGFRLLYDQNSC